MEPEVSFPHSQKPRLYRRINPVPRSLCMIHFYGEELLAPRPISKLEDHRLSADRCCLFNIFAATLHIWRPFLHPQPEDTPQGVDRDPLIQVTETYTSGIEGVTRHQWYDIEKCHDNPSNAPVVKHTHTVYITKRKKPPSTALQQGWSSDRRKTNCRGLGNSPCLMEVPRRQLPGGAQNAVRTASRPVPAEIWQQHLLNASVTNWTRHKHTVNSRYTVYGMRTASGKKQTSTQAMYVLTSWATVSYRRSLQSSLCSIRTGLVYISSFWKVTASVPWSW
jgi:hypothetical protein